MKVLVTEANSKNSLAACRALSRAGHKVFSLGPRGSICHSSKYSDVSLLIKGEKHYFEELLAYIELHQIDIVIPVGARSVYEFHAHRGQFNENFFVALPGEASLAIALNKASLQEQAQKVGIQVPSFKIARTYAQLKELIENSKLPFVVKSTSHLANSQTLYIESEFERDRVLRLDIANPLLLQGPVQVQQRVEGHGEGFFALYQNGELKNFMMHQRLREYPSTGGSSSAAMSIFREDLYIQGKALLDSLNWHGPAMVEFKRSVEGQLHLIELNPKLWGSLDLSIAAGMNVPMRIAEMSTNSSLVVQKDFETDLVFWWPLDSLTSIFRPPAHRLKNLRTNVEINDLLPSLNMLLQLCYVTLFTRVGGGLLGRLRHWQIEHGVLRALLRFWNEILGLPTKTDSKLSENLWIGAKPSWFGRFILKRFHGLVTYSLLEDFSGSNVSGFNLNGSHIPEHVEISESSFFTVLGDLNLLINSGKKVFLHCREGVGRAPSVAIAYLVSNGWSLEDAVSVVKEKRSITRLSRLQQDSLARFSQRLSDS